MDGCRYGYMVSVDEGGKDVCACMHVSLCVCVCVCVCVSWMVGWTDGWTGGGEEGGRYRGWRVLLGTQTTAVGKYYQGRGADVGIRGPDR